MSAGICIMNKNAIVLAADSAVTIGNHVAIHNSANKLFSLSYNAPIGVIIYANSTLMSMPVEIIVKEYKKQLGNKDFPHLKDYVDDFIKYVESKSKYFRFDINEKDYILQVFISLIEGLNFDYNKFLNEEKQKGITLNDSVIKSIAETAVKMTIQFVNQMPIRPEYNFKSYIKTNYIGLFKDFIKKRGLSWLTDEQINEVCEKSCSLYDTDFERSGYVGVAIGGYGKDEIYPHLTHIHISGFIDGKLKWKIINELDISENNGAMIVPLAQVDVMQTFLFGINDEFIKDLAGEIPKRIDECINSIDMDCLALDKKSIVQGKMKSVTKLITDHMADTANKKYMIPILQSVASLPIEELALLAESMINITSLKRKVVNDKNIGTVGGPVDVSVISKGDGFIWLKRKHYFDEKYNPQYFYTHFNKYDIGDSNEDD